MVVPAREPASLGTSPLWLKGLPNPADNFPMVSASTWTETEPIKPRFQGTIIVFVAYPVTAVCTSNGSAHPRITDDIVPWHHRESSPMTRRYRLHFLHARLSGHSAAAGNFAHRGYIGKVQVCCLSLVRTAYIGPHPCSASAAAWVQQAQDRPCSCILQAEIPE